MDCPGSGAPAVSLAFGLMARFATSTLDGMARSSQEPAGCRLRSTLHEPYRFIAFPDHSVEKAEIQCSRCSRQGSRGLCLFARIAIRMLSSSRPADVLSLNSNRI
jgi:hypothetical protein